MLLCSWVTGKSVPGSQARSKGGYANFATAAVLQGPYQTEKPSDPGTLLAEAKARYESGDFAAAQQIAERYLDHSPASFEAMYLIGHSYEREKKAKESLEWFTKAAALSRPNAEDLRTVGLDYVLLNDYPDAIRWLERAVVEDATDAEAWYALGRARMTVGNTQAAEKALRNALELEPRLVKAENNLGVLYESENRPADAIRAYREAIAWQSTAPQPSEQPLLNLGTLLVTQQKGKDALTFLQQAEAIAPGSAKIHEQLARALDQVGDPAAAMAQMQIAIQLEEKNPRLHFVLGQMYRRAGMTQEAAAELALSRQLYGAHSTPQDQ